MSSSSTPRTRDNSLDFARGIAILMVMRWHSLVPETSNRFTRLIDWPFSHFGWAGVDLFFVLSGFLIGGLLMREALETSKIDVKRFLLRRGYKIWPAYLVYIILAGLIINHRGIGPLLPNFLHLQNYLGTPLSHTWSLAVEEHFYLFLTLMLAWFASRRVLKFESIAKLCICVFVVSFAGRVIGLALGQDFVQVQWESHDRIDTLMLGILLAALYRYRPDFFARLIKQKGLLLCLVSISVLFMRLVPQQSYLMSTIGLDIVAIGCASLLLLLFGAVPGQGLIGKARETWWFKLVAQVGFFSYGIYLWHRVGAQASVLLLKHLSHLGTTMQWWIATLAYVVVAIVVGVVATKAVELPFLAIRDKKLPSKNANLAYAATVPTSDH